MAKILYAGDSTVKFNKIDSYPQTGMSQALLLYLREGVKMRSFAQNGRSTKSFIAEGRLAAIEKEIEPGDALLVQFGHNNAKKEDPSRYTCPETDFQENLLKFAAAARQHKAYVVFITPIARRLFDEKGVFLPGSHGAYPDAMKKAAARAKAPLIDLTSITEEYLAGVGELWSRPLFVWPKDNTHLKYEGTMVMAGFLCREMRKLGEPYRSLFIEEEEG